MDATPAPSPRPAPAAAPATPSRLLYVLRHATAQDKALPIPDADRKLVPKGRRQMRRVATFCAQQGLKPAVLLASPIRRAHETAACLAHHLKGCGPVALADWLRTGATTEQTLAGLQAWLATHESDPWLVGHEPGLSLLLAALLGAPPVTFVLKKASLSCVALPPGAPAQLLWTLPCRLMG